MDNSKTITISLMIALSIVLGYVEFLIPLSFIPGFKIGLSNIAIIFVLYVYSSKDALIVSLTRLFILSIFTSTFLTITFGFSLGGAILSFIMMALFKKIKIFSIVGVSIIGSVTHTLGQILVGSFLLNNINLFQTLPVLLILNTITGLIIGRFASKVITYYCESQK